MDVPVLRQTLAIFICIRLLGVVNFDYFLRQGCESPWFSLLPLLVVPVEELCMFHECLLTTEPQLLPMSFIEARGGPPWGMLVKHAMLIQEMWKQIWLNRFQNLPFLRQRNHFQ